MRVRTKIFFDGGARPNPGRMEIAVVIGGDAFVECDVGHGSAMDAEWMALIAALQRADEQGAINPILIGDAATVVAQANGAAARGASAGHLERFRALVGSHRTVRVRHVKRSHNLAGIALSRMHAR